jgi:hypothetical protein
MKKILFGGLMMTILATSCKKDDPAGPAAGSYLTKTAGTTWNYRYTDLVNPTANEDYTVTCAGRDTAAFGKSYTVYTTSYGESIYRTAVGSDYYQIDNILGISYENKYMADNVSAGTAWTTPVVSTLDFQGQTATLTASVRTTVVSKGGTLGINGKDYTDVINTKIEILSASLAVAVFNIPVSFTTQNVNEYHSPKYGLIKRTANIVASVTIPIPGQGTQEVVNTNNTDELMSSSIQ